MSKLVIMTAAALLLSGAVAAAPPPLAPMPFWSTAEQNVFSTGMVWRDCNNDGIIDAFFSNGNDMAKARNSIYLFGTGTPPASASWLSDNYDYSGHCAVGDINDDGYPDFVVSNYLGVGFGHPNVSNLYLNDGGLPHTTSDWNTPDSLFSFSCALGDFDNDGDLDLVVATGEGYYSDLQPDVIYRNDGGTFTAEPVWESEASTAALDVAWGDVDNDGDLDLAFAYDDNRATALFYNNAGMIETTPSWQSSSVQSGNTLLFGDVNGDGWLDLIVAYNNQTGGTGHFRVYFNDGTGQLDPDFGWESATGGYGSALALYDYDDDGDDDLAAGRWYSDVYVYENLGNTFTTTPVWQSGLDVVSEELAWVDLDADGVQPMADTIPADGGRKLFYTTRHPLYAIDSVKSDGADLGWPDYCFDLVSGWVSLAEAPSDRVSFYYRYSFHNDLVTANWDTVNMAFGNTNGLFTDLTAEPPLGPAPLSVQLSDHSPNVSSWHWQFGDGEEAEGQNPSHLFEDPGFYDVTLSVAVDDRIFNRTFEGLVSVYADTVEFSKSAVSGSRVRVDLFAHHYLPIGNLVVPFGWTGPLSLRLDSISTVGCLTDYFDDVRLTSLVPAWKVATVNLGAGGRPYLPPGDGRILSIWFTETSGASSGSNPVFFTSYSGRELKASTYAGDYVPETVDGAAFVKCCQGVVGDVNGVGGDEPTIGDISVIIDHLFVSGVDLPCIGEADANLSGGINPSYDDITIGDISVLIDHLFITLAPLPSCPQP